MFDYVSGRIAAVEENKIVVDVGGVGFLLTASAFACAEYSRKSEAKVPVYLAVREDALELYGFKDEAERKLFTLLIGVSGVGAKLAITILSGLNGGTLTSAIAGGDVGIISSVKGVGKKTAERIVLELKGKVETQGAVAAPGDVPFGALDEAAVNALIGLGYEKKEAEAAVKKATKQDMTTEQIIRAVLQG